MTMKELKTITTVLLYPPTIFSSMTHLKITNVFKSSSDIESLSSPYAN